MYNKKTVSRIFSKYIFLIIISSFYFSQAAAHTDNADNTSVTQIIIPQTSEKIWQEIDHQITDLETVIQEKHLEKVHLHAYAIRDLARALPEHSSELKSDQIKAIDQQTKFIDTLAQRLDKSGDAGDLIATQDNMKKLKNILTTIRENYPLETKTQEKNNK